MTNELPKQTLIIEAADGLTSLELPFAFCIEAIEDTTFTALEEIIGNESGVEAQAVDKTLDADKRIYGKYTAIHVASGKVLAYIKDTIKN